MKRFGKVYYKDIYAGKIEQFDGQYRFIYDAEYLRSKNAQPISLVLPLRPEPYADKTMLPYFDGLIPEGWLLNLAEKNWKIDSKDRMSLLLTLCQDCIGAVKVMDASEED